MKAMADPASGAQIGNGLRVLMITPQFRPLTGGYERAAERLSRELAREGHAVTVLAERRDRAWPAIEVNGRFMVRRLFCVFRAGLHMITSLPAYAAFILRHGAVFDVIHVHQYGQHAGLAVLLGRLRRTPVVLKMTSTSTEGISRLSGTTLRARLLATLHRRVDACIATTVSAAQEARRFRIPDERVHQVPNGLDTDQFMPVDGTTKAELRRQLGIPGGPVCLYVGRLSPAKDPEGLITAWAVVHDSVPEARLVIVGDGPLRDAVRARIRSLNLGGCVSLAGEQSEVTGWYQAADLFVLPSRYEGLSNSLLEAMSCGLPVVSTRVSGSVEIFEAADIGAIVPADDSAALALALTRLLQDEDGRRRCGECARTYAMREFSISSVTRRTVELYRQLLRAREPVR